MLIPDALTDILQPVRLESTHAAYFQFTSPWGIRIPNDDDDEAVFHIVMRGQCWLLLNGQFPPIPLASGDLVILLQGHEHIVCDDLASPVVDLEKVIVIQPNHGYKQISYGGNGQETELVSGCFQFQGDRHHNPLLLALPPLIHIKNEAGQLVPWLETTLQFIASEIAIGQLGCQNLVARLIDVLFIQAVRAYINGLSKKQGNWLCALTDAEIGISLSLMHRYPEKFWTVASLAQKIPMSRSAFAARFVQLVGQSPMRYLTSWRMMKAADLLRESQLGIREIATQVGYESEVAFRKSFKRWAGVAPGIYRRRSCISKLSLQESAV
ncbi:hypothetical protein BZZ01_14190 [Nostocales cyanobacterium HT-58-2]|nr:hypothetical protein BZZ01_14190 [Nostocales cyanobacterium HT-58-2]